MAAPTYVNQYATAFNSTTSPKTAMSAVEINAGDVLVGMCCAENWVTALSIAWTENGTASWVSQRSAIPADNVQALGSTYVCTGGENLTVTATDSGSRYFGGNVIRFSGSDGVGASNVANGSGSPSVSLTTTQANSAIVAICGDWNAVAGTQTFTLGGSSSGWIALTDFPGDASHYGVAIAYHSDAGAAGAKTIAMSAPTGQKYVIIVIEVKGTAAAAATSLVIPSFAAMQSILAR